MCASRWPSLSGRCALSRIGWAWVSMSSWFLSIETGLHTSSRETGSRRHARIHGSLLFFSSDPLKGKHGTLNQLCWLEDRQQSPTLPRLTTSWQLQCFLSQVLHRWNGDMCRSFRVAFSAQHGILKAHPVCCFYKYLDFPSRGHAHGKNGPQFVQLSLLKYNWFISRSWLSFIKLL